MVAQEFGIRSPQMLFEMSNPFIRNRTAQLLKFNDCFSFGDMVDLIDWKLPIIVVEPIVIEINLVRLFLRKPGRDLNILGQSYYRPFGTDVPKSPIVSSVGFVPVSPGPTI